jgi:ADP-dependent NAD(P)H-hydrate dehydratase / NAD(P)H-hydrate epimerase
MKILSTNQIRELDAYTIKHRPIASIDLMESACHAVFTWITQNYYPTEKVGVICGTGNNGGDGLGVARLLIEAGYSVNVSVVRSNVPESADFKINLERIPTKVQVNDITDKIPDRWFADANVIIDALFGSGLSRPPEGIYAEVIHYINSLNADKVAIDIPSGLMADKHSEGPIVKAKTTLTFQVPKLAFLFPQYHEFVGNWVLLDIGLHKDFLKELDSSYHYFTRKAVRKILRVRSKFDHKGKFGHALLIAGSYGKIGAAILAARAALRSGVGLLTVHIPIAGYPIIQTAVPEAMVSIDRTLEVFSDSPTLDPYTSIGFGPGLGQAKETVNAIAQLLERSAVPAVLDADALNILGANRELLQLVREGSILTPHPKEFERLAGGWKNDFERLDKQKRLANDLKSVIVLKGAYTSIAAPGGEVFFNSSGNPGMAKGGSGDVLTGILTSFLAQGYSGLEAAQIGVFLHGFAGDLAAYEKGMNGLIPSDLVEFLPEAYKRAE